MAFAHERLDVYQAALEFLVLAEEIREGFPRGRSYLADQITRASISIVLNLAEGAGKYQAQPHGAGKHLLDRIAATTFTPESGSRDRESMDRSG
jgi:hypothetical protein